MPRDFYKALHGVFMCGVSGQDPDDAQRRADMADFAASGEFQALFKFLSWDLMIQFLKLFDHATFVCAFTHDRIECVIDWINAADPDDNDPRRLFNDLLGVVAHVSTQLPEFARSLSSVSNFDVILRNLSNRWCIWVEDTPNNLMMIFSSILNAVPNRALAAQQLLANGAVKLCCNFIMSHLLLGFNCQCLNSTDAALILRMLHLLIIIGNASPDHAMVDNDVNLRENPFVVEFIASRGLQALDLLHYDDRVLVDGGGPVLFER